jgi:hypothetical protein
LLNVFEAKLVKWIFLPFFIGVLLFALFKVTLGERNCKQVCKEKGFFSSNYIPKSKSCFCKTEAESQSGKFVLGVQVF